MILGSRRIMQISRFQLLAGTEAATLDGELIVGRFGKTPLVIANAARLCEQFANLPERASEILQFTKKYAPLIEPAKIAGDFRFELCTWRAWRQTFRNDWRTVASLSPEDRSEKEWTFPPGS